MRSLIVGTKAMLLAGALTAMVACEPPQSTREIRISTDDLSFRIAVSPMPPHAEELAEFKVFVQDKETGQPIETGEGRLFATNQEKTNSYDGLAKGQEVGTYYARIRFPVSGDWALGMQFRRDSTQKLQQTPDWIQTVLPAPPLGTPPGTPSSTPARVPAQTSAQTLAQPAATAPSAAQTPSGTSNGDTIQR